MYTISKITHFKKVDYCVWHVIFQMDNNPLEYATDFLFLLKEKKWVVNSLITHELTSLMEGYSCVYCGQTKIACFVTSKEFKQIKQGITENEQFRTEVGAELEIKPEKLSTDLLIVNDKIKWDQLALENRFYGNLLRIQNRQQ